MNLITATQSSVLSDERRRHPRRRVSSIVYVKLDDGNGGILLNLGIGGLSFQAVAALRPEQDVVLNFGLFDTSETITVAGRIAWLGPTRKEVGLRFNELPYSSEQGIANWMSNHEKAPDSIESPAATPLNLVSEDGEPPLPSLDASVPVIPAPDAVLDPPVPRRILPSHSLLGNGPASAKPRAPLALEESRLSPMPTTVLRFEQSSAAPTLGLTQVGPEPLQPVSLPAPPSPAASSKQLFSSGQIPPDSAPARVVQSEGRQGSQGSSGATASGASAGYSWSSLTQKISSLEEKRRRKLFTAFGLAACIGIMVLTVVRVGFNPGIAPTPAVPEPAAVSTASPAVGIAMQRPVERPWLASIRRIFWGDLDNPALDPSAVAVLVWTDQKSGFYYCSGSPYFAKLKPGSVVTQGDALQNGYQPKLGSYCQ